MRNLELSNPSCHNTARTNTPLLEYSIIIVPTITGTISFDCNLNCTVMVIGVVTAHPFGFPFRRKILQFCVFLGCFIILAINIPLVPVRFG
jgi:hypothetical protein